MDERRLSGLIRDMIKYRQTGEISESLSSKCSELTLFNMQYQDTVYGGMMVEALRAFWNEPDYEQTLRHAIKALFKHLHLKITPHIKKTFLQRHKIELF